MSAFGPKQTCGKTQSMSLLGVKRTCLIAVRMSAFDPKRTSASALHMSAPDPIVAFLGDFGAVRQIPECSQASAMSDGWLACSSGSGQGRNHHNFNEHPGSPKVGREASPYRRVCQIDPLVPNRIVIFEETHVSDPDLSA